MYKALASLAWYCDRCLFSLVCFRGSVVSPPGGSGEGGLTLLLHGLLPHLLALPALPREGLQFGQGRLLLVLLEVPHVLHHGGEVRVTRYGGTDPRVVVVELLLGHCPVKAAWVVERLCKQEALQPILSPRQPLTSH